ncbi:diguanylate cyclase [Sphingobacteriaceae bacterium]|nr:diguanylate cyclase [Sphingobacteriaceae bacterium]
MAPYLTTLLNFLLEKLFLKSMTVLKKNMDFGFWIFYRLKNNNSRKMNRDKKNNADLNSMMCLDIYLTSLSQVEYLGIKNRIKPSYFKPHPLTSLGVPGSITKNVDQDLTVLQRFSKLHTWQVNLKEILATPHQALILTDGSLKIQWINEGFTKMTGYDLKQVVGQTPKLLQGKGTSEETKARIRKKINAGMPFTEEILNYRYNKEEYTCRLSIFQIHNSKNQVTHFLALESEVA